MVAILETSTAFAEDLLSRPVGRLRLLGVLLRAGAMSVATLAVGIPLLRLVEREPQ